MRTKIARALQEKKEAQKAKNQGKKTFRSLLSIFSGAELLTLKLDKSREIQLGEMWVKLIQ